METSPTAIIKVDRNVEVTLWNPAAERLFGYTADEAVGATLDDLVATTPELHAEAIAWTNEAWEGMSFRRIGRRTRKDGSLVDVEILAIREEQEDEPSGFFILYHDVTELEHTRRRLEARIDEQMAELVRTGELARFLPRQVAESLMAGALRGRGGIVRAPPDHRALRRHGRVHRSGREPRARGARRGAERLPPRDDGGGDRVRRVRRQPDRRRRHGGVRRAEADAGGRPGMGRPSARRWRCTGGARSWRTRSATAGSPPTSGSGSASTPRIAPSASSAARSCARTWRSASRSTWRLDSQTAADPGSVLCGFRTYALVKDRVNAEERGALTVKGARRPVEVWEIVGLQEADRSER